MVDTRSKAASRANQPSDSPDPNTSHAAKQATKIQRCPDGFNITELQREFRRYITARNQALLPPGLGVTPQHHPAQESTPPRPAPAPPGRNTGDAPSRSHSAAPRVDNPVDYDMRTDSSRPTLVGAVLPDFEDLGDIEPEARRKALQFAQAVALPEGGPFTGIADRRPLRRMLAFLRELTTNECLNALEYNAMLNRLLADNVRQAIPGKSCYTHLELISHLEERVDRLIKMYSASDYAQRLQTRKIFSIIRQGSDEQLTTFVERFDTAVTDLRNSAAALDEREIKERFIQALKPQERERAALMAIALPQASYETLRAELLAMEWTSYKTPTNERRLPNETPNASRFSRNDQTPSVKCTRCGSQHDVAVCRMQQDVTCNTCHAKGHISRICPKARRSDQTNGRSNNPTQTSASNQGPKGSPAAHHNRESYHVEVNTIDRRGIADTSVPNLPCQLGHLRDCNLLLDSGSGCSLIARWLADKLNEDGRYSVGTNADYTMKSAFGSLTSSSTTITLPVGFQRRGRQKARDVQFVVIDDLSRPAILGRDAMTTIGLTLRFGESNPENESSDDERESEEAPRDIEICHITSERLPVIADEAEQAEHLDVIAPAASDSRIANYLEDKLSDLHVPPQARKLDKQLAKLTLDHIVKLGPMEFAKDYTVRLEAIATRETDTAIQEYCFVIAWTVTAPQDAKKPWNSSLLIQKLSDNHKAEWKDHIQGYLTTGWWIPEPRTNGATLAGSPGVVFPVTQSDQKTTTCRPCCDFRRLNAISPRVSATTLSVADAIWLLRSHVQELDEIDQFDLAKAFYRIRVAVTDHLGDRLPLRLKVGNDGFISDRLVFGLACGPSSLNATQTIIRVASEFMMRTALGDGFAPSKLIIVMDDYLFIGPQATNCVSTEVFDLLWNLTGFESPPKKRSKWTSSAATRWLGGHWTWDAASAHLSFTRPTLPPVETPIKWTKRVAFRYAGRFTAGLCSYYEALSRVHADAIRSIAGRTASWDEPISDPAVTKELLSHLREATANYDRALQEEKRVSLLCDVVSAHLVSDASLTGLGFLIKDANDHIIFAYGRLFGRTQWPWHINRKELYALSYSLQRFDGLLYGLRKLESVTCYTDSRVALAHTNAFKETSSKSIERRVILRLRRAILELCALWNRHGLVCSIEHIKGENNPADPLSRVCTKTYSEDEIMSIELADKSHSLHYFPSFRKWLNCRRHFKVWWEKRRHGAPLQTITSDNLLRHFIHSLQRNDSRCQALISQLNKVQTQGEHSAFALRNLWIATDGVVERKIDNRMQLVIPDSLLKELMLHLHTSHGHASVTDTLHSFFIGCYHPLARKVAKSVVTGCMSCQLASSTAGAATTYGPIRRPPYAFETIGIDLFGPLSRRSGRSTGCYILTVVDRLTGYTLFMVIRNGTGESVVAALEKLLVLLGQRTKFIVSDNGTQFASEAFTSLVSLWAIRHIRIPIYTPSAGGFYETKHKTAVHTLRTLLIENPFAQWDVLALIAAQQINGKVSPDRSSSPHELLFGWPYVWPSANAFAAAASTLAEVHSSAVTESETLDEARARQDSRRKLLLLWAEEFEQRQSQSAARFEASIPANREALRLGDRVMFATTVIRAKFANQCTGPFELLEQVGKQTWRAMDQVTGKTFVLSSRRLRKLPRSDDLLPSNDDSTEPNDIKKTITTTMITTTEPCENLSTNPIRPRTQNAEEKFLSGIAGQSRFGRVRRGSMSKNYA